MKNLSPVIFLLAMAACSEDSQPVFGSLEGKWVEVHTLETLTFETIDGNPWVTLDRGKEKRDGVEVPKDGSGPYEYKLLQDDKIALRWALSSNSNFHEHYFRQNGNTLTIGRFFDTPSPSLMIFMRVR
jgi:hypothetical protein